MKIRPISRKGKNRVKEGLGTEVVVLLKDHPSNQPAVFVAPISMPNLSSKFCRWIWLQDDPDFEIIEE